MGINECAIFYTMSFICMQLQTSLNFLENCQAFQIFCLHYRGNISISGCLNLLLDSSMLFSLYTSFEVISIRISFSDKIGSGGWGKKEYFTHFISQQHAVFGSDPVYA